MSFFTMPFCAMLRCLNVCTSFSLLAVLSLFASYSAQAQIVAEKKASADVFPIPQDIENFEQFLAFAQKIDGNKPEGRNEQEVLTHERKVARTIATAAEQFSEKSGISDQEVVQSTFIKMQAITILDELGEPKAKELLAKAIAKADTDKRAEVQFLGMKFTIESSFKAWDTYDSADKSVVIKKITDYVNKNAPNAGQVNMVMTVVDFLGDASDEKYALELLTGTTPHFRTSKEPQIQAAMDSLKGVIVRLQLPGKEIQLEGTLLDGTEVDWSAYRGKVVLVDFWATWCGPCREEVPNILKMYKAYHEKGFEVLSISLDDRREQAESYLKQNKIPWATMFSKNPEERAWKHPMAVRYGINGIPRAILVDRDGKVVHMSARGETLGRELRRLLGEPVARTAPRRDMFIQQASATTANN